MSQAGLPAIHPLLQQLFERHGCTRLDADGLDAFAAAPGHALLFFAEDPVRYRETLDLAVIAPELARTFAGCFRTGVLLPEAARAVAPRYGFRRWPALVLLRDGRYLGAIDGVRSWDEYLREIAALLAAEPRESPVAGDPPATRH